ncbi:MAG: sigma-54 dependent transcriptional regulator [Planctomycetota bacterium]
MLSRLLLAGADAKLTRRVERLLRHWDGVVQSFTSGAEFWRRAPRESCDTILVDLRLLADPPEQDLPRLKDHPEQPDIVVLSREEDPRLRARLLAAGCSAVLYLGLADDELSQALETLLARHRESALRRMEPAVRRPRLSDFASNSRPMQQLLLVVEKVKDADASLLILGETGAGKEWLARAIHDESPRSSGPFVAINCSAVPETLLESELFGHEVGAFTGATHARRGYFELAHRGTLFLDEIGEMPLHLQARLLRVLQDRQVQRLGAESALQVDVRLMAATNRDITSEVATGRFRRDLFYRLSVVMLAIPALRERLEDIPVLVASYIEHFRPSVRRDVKGVTPEALQALMGYSWPGNVRELMNVVERAMLLASGDQIALEDLPENLGAPAGTVRLAAGPTLGPLPAEWLARPLPELRKQLVDELERAYITQTLAATDGRVGEAARRAGIQPRSLFSKMRLLGVAKEPFRRHPSARPRN